MYSAERISPQPRLKTIRQPMGYISIISFQLKFAESTNIKTKRRTKFIPKFIREDTFCDRRKIYLGTFTFEKIKELLKREIIPVEVDSLK